jgi:hemolysin-activating ACP:hemolysin acyltransferase
MSMTDLRSHHESRLAVTQLRAVQPRNGHLALGMAVSFLMRDPAFARLIFGHWSRVLVGQINRRHFVFVVDGEQVVGFAGWALATKNNAEAWLTGRRELTYEESKAGEIVVVNAWKAATPAAHRFLVDAVRRVIQSKDAVYYKRFYSDGRTRPVRLPVTEFVALHVERKAHRTLATTEMAKD